jgi:hypothetical protein
VDEIAPWFRADFGRPSKELYTILGVLVLQQMQDLTDDDTVNQTICAMMRRPVVWPSAGPTSRPWSFEIATAGGPASKGPSPNMTG